MSTTFQDLVVRHEDADDAFARQIQLERAGTKDESELQRLTRVFGWIRSAHRFAEAMAAKLFDVRHKRHWGEASLPYRLHRVRQEFLEMHEAYDRYWALVTDPESSALDIEAAEADFRDELVDLANTSMIAAEYLVGN